MTKKYSNKTLSIDFEDDNRDYEGFNHFLEDNTKRKRNVDANEITEFGNLYLAEIEHKNAINNKKKEKLIKYIVSKSDQHSLIFLNDLDYNDVLDIYNEVKGEKKSVFLKIIDFFS